MLTFPSSQLPTQADILHIRGNLRNRGHRAVCIAKGHSTATGTTGTPQAPTWRAPGVPLPCLLGSDSCVQAMRLLLFDSLAQPSS